MVDGSAPVLESTRNVSKVVLWIFAAVGFLAAVVQIATYFAPGHGQLQVRVTPHTATIQQTILSSVKDTSEQKGFLVRMINDDKEFYCQAAKATKESADQKILADKCSQADAAEAVTQLLRRYTGSTPYLDYVIDNTGRSIARKVRISAEDLISVELIRSSGDDNVLERNKSEDFYDLPDLNPGEKIKLRAWSSNPSFSPDYEWLSKGDVPKITFDGGNAGMTLFKLTPSAYSDLHDFLATFPLPVSIIFVLLVATLVGVLVLVIVSVVAGLVQGQSLAEIFRKPVKPEAVLETA